MKGFTEPLLPAKILFLTNNENTKRLSDWLAVQNEVIIMGDVLTVAYIEEIEPDFVISFNYRHIISSEVIKSLPCSIVNIHCSVLPWNKGASPNFFSYFYNTPKGITVHELTEGLDKGRILLQRILKLNEDETFASSYEKLIDAAIQCVQENWHALIKHKIEPFEQNGEGSYHCMAELIEIREKYPFEWEDNICDWKARNGLE